ncbi:MAG: hypothetical protein ACOC5I_00775 [Gemmatimonadota bacterium]
MSFRRVACFLIVLAAAGCASTGEPETTGSEDARVYVEVENDTHADLDIRLLARGQTIRLGRIHVGDTQRLRVPPTILDAAPYEFAVHVVARDGTGTYTTPVLTVPDGQNVHIMTRSTLSTSRFAVR